MECPKCGNECSKVNLKRLSKLDVEYNECRPCGWSDLSEQEGLPAVSIELFKPINWAERGIEWKRFDEDSV